MRVGLAGPVRVEPLLSWLNLTPDRLELIPRDPIGTPVTDIAGGLLQRGHEVVVAAVSPYISQRMVLSGPSLRVYLAPGRAKGRTHDAYRAERRHVASVLNDESPDLVHAHWTYEYALGALKTDLPVLITVRDWAPRGFRLQPELHRLVRLGMNARTLMRGTDFTVTSPYTQQRLRRWLRRRVPIIPNGVPDELFGTDERHLNEDAPTILAVNKGFGSRKNVTTLLEAFRILRQWLPSCRLLLVGGHYQVDGHAHQWAMSRALADGVEFLGPIAHDRIPRMMRRADLFVHPSLEETFGMVLVEAMAQGTPVVAGARSGGVPWVLGDGAGGLLADVGSPRPLATAMISVLSDQQQWSRYARAGRAHSWQHFRLSVGLEQYIECYETLAHGTRL